MKKLVIIVGVLIVAGATLPLWGGCSLNGKACSAWCEVRHFNSDAARLGCKARCTSDKLSCIASDGAKGVDDFMSGLKGK